MKKELPILGIIGILVLVVFVSGCTTSTSEDLSQTFSNGGITFKYPSSISPTNETTGTVVSGGSGISQLGTLAGNGLTIHVSKADLNGTGLSVQNLKDATKENIRNGTSITMLADNSTTANGLTIYEFTFTMKNPTSNTDSKSLYAITGKDGQIVYYLQFVADPNTLDSNMQLINKIINTIQVQ
jgi:hypothetical protein